MCLWCKALSLFQIWTTLCCMSNIPTTRPLPDPETPRTGVRLCARCGVVFVCGVAKGDDVCWCMGLPNIITLDDRGAGAASACMCPSCLKSDINRKMHSPLIS